jgi:hypothetical protein
MGELDCAITLAAAAEGMLTTNDDRYLFRQLRSRSEATDIDFNLVVNWLKHPEGPDQLHIGRFEAAAVIARAITKFLATYHQSTLRFEGFLRKAYEDGVIPIKMYKDSN